MKNSCHYSVCIIPFFISHLFHYCLLLYLVDFLVVFCFNSPISFGICILDIFLLGDYMGITYKYSKFYKMALIPI